MKKSQMNDALNAYFDAQSKHVETFGKSYCGFEMCCGDQIIVTDSATGKHYAMPKGETAARFNERIQRSIQVGRNLFFEEWKPIEIRHDVLF